MGSSPKSAKDPDPFLMVTIQELTSPPRMRDASGSNPFLMMMTIQEYSSLAAVAAT